jgi:hypothetical protein
MNQSCASTKLGAKFVLSVVEGQGPKHLRNVSEKKQKPQFLRLLVNFLWLWHFYGPTQAITSFFITSLRRSSDLLGPIKKLTLALLGGSNTHE